MVGEGRKRRVPGVCKGQKLRGKAGANLLVALVFSIFKAVVISKNT